MESRARKFVVTGVLGVLGTFAGGIAVAVQPEDSVNLAHAASSVAAGDDIPPSAVEDFRYPGADRILAEKGIKLISGDGHILLAECGATADQIKLWSRTGDFCFQAKGSTGQLSLEVPDVWALETSTHPISAELTAEGETQSVDLPQDGYKLVGEGNREAPTTVVEIRVTG